MSRRLFAALVALTLLNCPTTPWLALGAPSTPVPQGHQYENPADRPEPMPAQPTGPRIGRRDSVMNTLRPGLAEWVRMWRAAMPGFQVDSLWLIGRQPWKIAWQEVVPPPKDAPWAPWEDEISAEVFTLTSPDSAYDLWIDADRSVTEHEGEFSIGGEPDSRSELVDRRHNRDVRLFDAGTMAGADWGRWFGPRRFALAGWNDASEFGHWKQGWISIYSSQDSTVTSYVTRIVPWERFQLYSAEWEKWIIARYRALKSRAR